jgi:peptidoglycan/LPS O-acetylase OafA/YrhL
MRNGSIDALRGLSIVLVIMHHIAIRVPLSHTLLAHYLPLTLLDALCWNGFESVLVFFVMSGFLITGNALRRWPSLGQPQFHNFYARRFARIAPCLIALVAVLSLLDLLRVPDYTITQSNQSLPMAIASAFGFFLNYYEGRTGYLPGNWDVLWSLSIEEIFYLGFPLACLIARRRLRAFCLILAVLSLAIALRHTLYPGNEIWREKAYLPGMAAIATGVLTAILCSKITFSRNQARIAIASGLTLYTAVMLFEDWLWPFLGDATLLLLTTGTAVLLSGATATPMPRRMMRLTSWLQSFGRLSYEIYLSHMFVVFTALRLFRATGATDRSGFLLYPTCLFAAYGLGKLVSRTIALPAEHGFLRILRVAGPNVPSRPSALPVKITVA